MAAWRSIIRRAYILFDGTQLEQVGKCLGELLSNAEAEGFGLTHQNTNHPELYIVNNANKGLAELQGKLKQALDPGYRLY